MTLEEKLDGWTGPSSNTEQDKQERTERMVREAIDAHGPFDDCSLDVYAKGSYANGTNVRADSDVDVAVQCSECCYWKEQSDGAHPAGSAYEGVWTPTKLRTELVAAMKARFGDQVDTTGQVAIQINSSSARVDADVVPCFDYRFYFDSGSTREGTRVVTKGGRHFENYPAQQLTNGNRKDVATGGRYKKVARLLKRIENDMVDKGVHGEVPSYFMECLAYNCPNDVLTRSTWTSTLKGVLSHIWSELEGEECWRSAKTGFQDQRKLGSRGEVFLGVVRLAAPPFGGVGGGGGEGLVFA